MRALVYLLTFFVIPVAQAQPRSLGSVFITGYIFPEYSLSINPDSSARRLGIHSGESSRFIGRVSESSNSPQGYVIHIFSRNGGRLQNQDSPQSSSIPYMISYDNLPMVRPGVEPKLVKTSGPISDPKTHQSPVRITFAGNPRAGVGNYSDTVYFQISAP